MNEYILKQDVLNLPQSIERNLRGEIVERSIDVKDVEALKPADVVQVVRCRNCKHHTYDEIFASFWCEYPGRVRDTTPDGFCEKGEE